MNSFSTLVILLLACIVPSASAQDRPWREYHSPNGRFTVQFPETPELSEKLDSASALRFHRFRVEDSLFVFFLDYTDYSQEEITKEGVRRMLDLDRDAFTRGVKGKRSGERQVVCTSHPGRVFQVRQPDGRWYHVKLCFARPRMYILYVSSIQAPDSADAVFRFLESFKILDVDSR